MKTIIKNCLNCHHDFEAALSEHKRGNAKFCCHPCSTKYNHHLMVKPKLPNCLCAFCNTAFYKNRSRQLKSRSGLFFCCRQHKDLAQRIGGIKEIQPDHYGNS